MANKDNAHDGQKTELMIKNSICNSLNPNVIDALKGKFKIKGDFENAARCGIYGEKADVRIAFDSGHYIDVNVKGYKIGFNQLVRRSIPSFCEDFDLSEHEKADLEKIFIKKAKNTKDYLFSEEDWKKWSLFFQNNVGKLLQKAFSKNPSREILVLYNKKTFTVKIYSMKDVLRFLSKQEITRTKGGFNIGKEVSFQRKGGDGNNKKYPKTNLKHPSNNVQMKLKIDNAFLENLKLAEYNMAYKC
jgi:hypothetical protein